MRTVVLAYHTIGCRGFEALLQHGYEIVGLFTHPDDPAENVWFDSVAELAARHGVPVFAPADINHPIWVAKLAALKPDVLFSFYYRRLVRPEQRTDPGPLSRERPGPMGVPVYAIQSTQI